jgi:hypothetical protein
MFDGYHRLENVDDIVEYRKTLPIDSPFGKFEASLVGTVDQPPTAAAHNDLESLIAFAARNWKPIGLVCYEVYLQCRDDGIICFDPAYQALSQEQLMQQASGRTCIVYMGYSADVYRVGERDEHNSLIIIGHPYKFSDFDALLVVGNQIVQVNEYAVEWRGDNPTLV